MPSTWYPIWIFLIFAISAGVAVLGSTLAPEQVNPRNVHSEVVCLMPLSFITPLISFDHVVVHDDRVVRHEGSHADRIVERHQRLDAGSEGAVVLLAQVMRRQIRALVDQVLDDRGRRPGSPRPSAA